MSHDTKSDAKFEEKLICCFQNHKNLENFDLSTRNSQNFSFDCNFWSKKAQRSYLSWHRRVMQNLKKNWLVVRKMIWGICQISTRALESLKIGTLMGFFCLKYKMHELKIYRGVMCNDTEEWCKIWREIDLSFQNWHA